ncbi:MAG: RDD family protein [Acidimicrobiia bacterium]|nr:RDD family protein [Acidimicrobiia bacterium]
MALMFFGLGFLWILISKDRRGWHDYIAGTCVIYDWDARVGTLLLARRREEAAGTPSPHR